FVVDDAIVMLENIVRHMEMGEKPFEAALKGSKEIAFTILSMTVSLAAVFIPVLFMGGIVGRLFREFSVVICVAILISGFVSLTLTPMLCSRFLQPHGTEKHGPLFMTFERFFTGMHRHYESSLKWVLGHRLATLIISFVILVLTALLFLKVPKVFIPDDDNNQVFAVVEGAQGASYPEMVRNEQAVIEIARQDPNIEAFYAGVGGGGASTLGGQNFGRMFFHLKPRSQRKLDVYGVIAGLRQKFA